MGNRYRAGFQLVIIALFLSLLSAVAPAYSQGEPTITGFSGSKIKLYKDSKTKAVWKKLSAKELKTLGGDYKIIAATNSRYAFKIKNETVWIKRKNAKTNGVKTGLPPCPKLASAPQEAAGNAVSRGAGASCK